MTKKNSTSHFQSASYFTFVGVVATTAHYFVAVGLEFLQILPALLANLIGFLVAFPLSFIGHHRFSFPSQGRKVHLSLLRFFIVAVVGFSLNQLLIYFNLKLLEFSFCFMLGLAMVLIAISTYLLSRYWVFNQ